MKKSYDPTLDPRNMFNPSHTKYKIIIARGSPNGLYAELSNGRKGTIPWADLMAGPNRPVGVDSFGAYEVVLVFPGNYAARVHVELLNQLLIPNGREEVLRYLRTHEVVVGHGVRAFRNMQGRSLKDLAIMSDVAEERLAEIEAGAFVSLGELMPVMEALEADYPMLRLAQLSVSGDAPVRVVEDRGPKAA